MSRKKDTRIKTEQMEMAMSDFTAYRLDRATVLRPFIDGKDDVDFLKELLTGAGAGLPENELGGGGDCYVAVRRGVIVGTTLYHGPEHCRGHDFFDQPNVACFGLMAVHPECRGDGIGTKMIIAVEKMSRKDGATELALDLPEEAEELVWFFRKRGYRTVGYVDGKKGMEKNILLSKKFLDRPVIFGEYTASMSGVEKTNGVGDQ